MATRRYMLNKGETEFRVTETVGAATVTKNIELTVNFDAPAGEKVTRNEVLLAINMFKNHILKGRWPPA